MPATKRQYLSADAVHRRLDDLRFEMSSGMSDEEVAKRTGVSVRTIQRWRLKEGLKRPKGPAKQLEDIYAISTFGEALGDVKHRTATSEVKGAWEPPVFVTRQHLDYPLFLRLLDAGNRLLGMTEEELCGALGVSPRSVEQGLAINAGRRTQRRCATCNDLMLSTEMFCSAICKRLHGRDARTDP